MRWVRRGRGPRAEERWERWELCLRESEEGAAPTGRGQAGAVAGSEGEGCADGRESRGGSSAAV